MNKVLVLVLSLLLAGSSFALNPAERKIVLHMQEQLDAGIKKYADQQDKITLADQKAAEAETHAASSDQHAAETDQINLKLSGEIDIAHKREQINADLVAKYKPFYEFGHKFWGIGSIIAGFGILATHLLILAAFIILLLLVFWALSFAFPILRPVISIGTSFLSSLWGKITNLFKKKS